MFLCRDDVLWLHPSGVFAVRGVEGVWAVGAPGVVGLMTPDGRLLFRAAVTPDSRRCGAVWTAEEIALPAESRWRSPSL